MGLTDLIFPKRCVNCRRFGDYICPNCFSYISFLESGTCFICQRSSIDFLTHPGCRDKFLIDGSFSSLAYNGVVKKLIYKFKYSPHMTSLEKALNELFYEGIIGQEILYKKFTQKTIFIPIPLHKSRYKIRGYNQSEMLADGLSQRLGISVLKMLIRVKNTPPQVKLKKEEREKNIKNAFSVDRKYLERIKNYENLILVDDVATSGATLKEAARKLKKSGANNVYGLTLAHGQ